MARQQQAIIFNLGDHYLDESKAAALLHAIASKEKATIKKLVYNFVSREIIKEINAQHLNHDYETDIITFQYGVNVAIKGEVYIAPEVVELNAKDLSVLFSEELIRVIIHGLLHLIGYNDLTIEEKREMRDKEDEYIMQWKLL